MSEENFTPENLAELVKSFANKAVILEKLDTLGVDISKLDSATRDELNSILSEAYKESEIGSDMFLADWNALEATKSKESGETPPEKSGETPPAPTPAKGSIRLRQDSGLLRIDGEEYGPGDAVKISRERIAEEGISHLFEI